MSVKMSDPSAPSEFEKRSTETTASTPLKFSATCTRLRHRWCIRCHWCFRELGAADRMGDRCRNCRAVALWEFGPEVRLISEVAADFFEVRSVGHSGLVC